MKCPGSIRLIDELRAERKIPQQTTNRYAMEGTAAHYIAELCLNAILNPATWDTTAEKYLDFKVAVNEKNNQTILVPPEVDHPIGEDHDNYKVFSVDEDMVSAVNVLLDYVRQVLLSLGATPKKGVPQNVATVEIEAHADLSFLGRDDLGGRVDVRITQFTGDMHIIDYKHGQGVAVDPEENTQLMIYGLGGNANQEMMPESVTLTIVQPRCAQNEAVTSWVISTEELQSWGQKTLLPAAKATDDKNAPLVPGEEQCEWCPAASGGHCDAAYNRALQIAKEEFPDDDELLADEETLKSTVLNMDIERILKLKKIQPFMEIVFEAVHTRIVSDLQAGREVPGWKLVEGQSRRKWKEEAEKELKAKRIPASILYEKKLASFTKIEKADKGKYKPLVDKLTEKPPGKTLAVPESDKRPAIQPSIQTDFDDDFLLS
jgi:hypothetical protein